MRETVTIKIYDPEIVQRKDWVYRVVSGAVVSTCGGLFEEVICFLPNDVTKEILAYQELGYCPLLKHGKVVVEVMF